MYLLAIPLDGAAFEGNPSPRFPLFGRVPVTLHTVCATERKGAEIGEAAVDHHFS